MTEEEEINSVTIEMKGVTTAIATVGRIIETIEINNKDLSSNALLFKK
jgi:archaellum component FlaC